MAHAWIMHAWAHVLITNTKSQQIKPLCRLLDFACSLTRRNKCNCNRTSCSCTAHARASTKVAITRYASGLDRIHFIMVSSLECPVCTNQYDFANMRRPMALPCGHTVCKQCISLMPVNTCPSCRAPFKPQNIAPNFTLQDILNDTASQVCVRQV